jgi:hypothetical protein
MNLLYPHQADDVAFLLSQKAKLLVVFKPLMRRDHGRLSRLTETQPIEREPLNVMPRPTEGFYAQ